MGAQATVCPDAVHTSKSIGQGKRARLKFNCAADGVLVPGSLPARLLHCHNASASGRESRQLVAQVILHASDK